MSWVVNRSAGTCAVNSWRAVCLSASPAGTISAGRSSRAARSAGTPSRQVPNTREKAQMSVELVNLLTEIRDQQKQQIENFERAVDGQNQYLDLQRKGRRMFQFLVYAPWGALA